MSTAHYKVVPHDGGFAYTLNGSYSEAYPTHEAALKAARRAAKEQRVPGETTLIMYETEDGVWHTEEALGIDRPVTDVEG
ncbi:MAG TPA: DUF2188 domain-containing protein [Acidocella sp.]|nr:DUF2188 domain-containing protein [Acidocella sp.]